MEENKVIEEQNVEKTFTQEEVNNLVKERLDRAEKKWQEKYSNYFSADDLASKTEELNNKIAELGNSLNEANEKATANSDEMTKKDALIAELESKAKKHETDSAKIRIALENGVPFELANKLSGETEEEIREDAKRMAQFMRPTTAPLRNPESPIETDGVMAAFKAMNPNIKI